MINKIKLILSKIKVAQLQQKKTLTYKSVLFDQVVLNVLWKNGYIYGYTKNKYSVTIFLRYSLRGTGTLNLMQIFSTKLTSKQISSLTLLDPYYSYLVFVNNKVYIRSICDLSIGGATLIAKL